MQFEDYNYGIYNKYILVDPTMNEDDREIFPGQIKGSNLNQNKKHKISSDVDETKSLPLTEH